MTAESIPMDPFFERALIGRTPEEKAEARRRRAEENAEQNVNQTFQVAGLNVTRTDLEELQTNLERISEAERQALRTARKKIIGHNALESQGE